MGELTNALQGKLNSRKGHVKEPGKSQLDLFSSLTDREITAPKIVMSKPEPPVQMRREPEMVLPPSSGAPPDVSADVRAVLSESGPARPVESTLDDGGEHPPLRTGVYHRPQRPAAPPPPRPPATQPSSGPRFSLAARMRIWFAGVELDRRMVSLVVVLCVLVGAIGFWSASPREAAVPEEPLAALAEPLPAVAAEPAPPPPAPASAGALSAAPAAATPTPSPADWNIPGTETSLSGGAYLVRFNDPVFVSGDKISIEGMRALKAVAAKLVTLKPGTRVVVMGHTDDVPLSKPTPQFKSNADIAAARAKVAAEHLAQFARAGKGLAFDSRAADLSQAPFPNDTPQNRRLNRTATVQVFPAP